MAETLKEPSERIVSMDQFRGYTVAAMFAVNFLGGLAAVPAFLKHHNVYFSYADSVMPSFFFAAGFSYRLSILRRLKQAGALATYGRIVRRSLGLVLVSLVMYGLGRRFNQWSQVEKLTLWDFVATLLKRDLWEVLAIIGATQLFLMPVIARGPLVRMLALIACGAGHAYMSHSFNFNFVHALPNWMDEYWAIPGVRCFDGGPFGVVSWAVAMLLGSLTYDLVKACGSRASIAPCIAWGCVFMGVGYAASCLTRLYDIDKDEVGPAAAVSEYASSPVIPPWEKLSGRSLSSLLAEPPGFPPPPPSQRQVNYWMMNKRVVTLSFILFASGLAMALYGVFIAACDVWGWQVGVFRTFGGNPLAAYYLHRQVEEMVHGVVPKDSPLWWCLVTFAIFFGIVYLLIWYLERQKIFIRL